MRRISQPSMTGLGMWLNAYKKYAMPAFNPHKKRFVFFKIVFYYLVFRLIHLFLAQYINIKQGILVYECTPGALGVQIGNLSRAAVVAHLFNPAAQEAESFAL